MVVRARNERVRKMRDKTIDVLLQMGVPASIKGFTYICDAIELFDTDPYYPDGKICSKHCISECSRRSIRGKRIPYAAPVPVR